MIKGIKNNQRYHVVNLGIFKIYINLSQTNRSEYIEMDLGSNGGTRTPIPLSLTYASTNTEEANFGIGTRLNYYKNASSYQNVINCDDSTSTFAYKAINEYIDKENQVKLYVTDIEYSEVYILVFEDETKTQWEQNSNEIYPYLISYNNFSELVLTSSSNKIQSIDNNLNDVINFTYTNNNVTLIEYLTNNIKKKQIEIEYSTSNKISRIKEINFDDNSNSIVVLDYSLTLTSTLIEIIDTLTNEKVKIEKSGSYTYIYQALNGTYSNKKETIFYSTYDTTITDRNNIKIHQLGFDDSGIPLFDFDNNYRVVSTKYNGYKLIEQSSPTNININTNKNLVKDPNFISGTTSWRDFSEGYVSCQGPYNHPFLGSCCYLSFDGGYFEQEVAGVNLKGDYFTLIVLGIKNNSIEGNFNIKIFYKETLESEYIQLQDFNLNYEGNKNIFVKTFKVPPRVRIKIRFEMTNQAYCINSVQLIDKKSSFSYAYDADHKLLYVDDSQYVSYVEKDKYGNVIYSKQNDYIKETKYNYQETGNYGISSIEVVNRGKFLVNSIANYDGFNRLIKNKKINNDNNYQETNYTYTNDYLSSVSDNESTFSNTIDPLTGIVLNETDERGIVTTNSYNTKTLLTQKNKDNKNINYGYLNSSHLLSTINNYQINYLNGLIDSYKINDKTIVSFEYDDLYRTKKTSLGNYHTSFTYNKNNLSSVVNGNVTYTYSYDVNNRLTSISDGSNVTSYTYDVDERLVEENYNNTSNLSYEYSKEGILENIKANVNNEIIIKHYQGLSNIRNKSFKQLIEKLYRSDEHTYYGFFYDDNNLKKIKTENKVENIINVSPVNNVTIRRFNTWDVVKTSSTNILRYDLLSNYSSTTNFSFYSSFMLYVSSGEITENTTVLMVGENTQGEGSLKIKIIKENNQYYLGLYLTKNSINHLLSTSDGVLYKKPLLLNSWNNVSVTIDQQTTGSRLMKLGFSVNNNNLMHCDYNGNVTFNLLGTGKKIIFGSELLVNETYTNYTSESITSICLSVYEGINPNIENGIYNQALVNTMNLEAIQRYHKCEEMLDGEVGRTYLGTASSFYFSNSQNLNEFIIYPLNGTYESLNGDKNYTIEPLCSAVFDPTELFEFNKDYKRYMYKAQGDVLKYTKNIGGSLSTSISFIVEERDSKGCILSIPHQTSNPLNIYLTSSRKLEVNIRGTILNVGNEVLSLGLHTIVLNFSFTGSSFNAQLFIDNKEKVYTFTTNFNLGKDNEFYLGIDSNNSNPFNGYLTNFTLNNGNIITNNFDLVMKIINPFTETLEYDEFGRIRGSFVYNKNLNRVIKKQYNYSSNGNKILSKYTGGNIAFNNRNFYISCNYTNKLISSYSVQDYSTSQQYGTTTNTYTYDNLGRLTKWNDIEYTYDDNGNILSIGDKILTYDTYNRLTSYNGTTITYDSNYEFNIKQLNGYTFNYQGRLITSVNGNNKTIEYKYNHNGQRIYKKINNEEINYVYLNNKLEAEIHSSYTLRFLYNALEQLIGFTYNDKEYFYVIDGLQTILGIVDSNGNLVVKYNYDPWGNILSITQVNDVDNIKDINPFVFKGYYYDKETQLYWLSSRYYSPELCRWISPDSIEYLDPESINGLNLYAYCNNDPVNKYDPTGHIAISLIVGLVVSFAIGTTASAISQYAQYGDVNWLQAGVDGLFAVASTALAYTGIGLIGSIAAGAGMGLAQYTLDSAVFHDDFSWSGALIATGLGALGGLASGRGAQHFKSIGSNLDDTGRTGVKAILTAFDKYGTGAGYQKVMNLWGGRVANSLAKSISQNFTKSALIIWGTTAATYGASYGLGQINWGF